MAIGDSDMTYELVPPDNHQRNMAEIAIQTLKDNFVSILSGCAPTFLLHLWCQLPPQVEGQLLLLRQSQLHPNLSAYAHVFGYHDYNMNPFVPIGMEALVQDKPHKRCTYAEHCKKAFVLGTFTEHYRCWKFWLTATRATQILGTAFFKHTYPTNPLVTPEDLLIAAAEHLTWALETSIPPHLRVSTTQALKDLSEVFTDAAHKYSNYPTIHMPDAPPTHHNQEPMASPKVPPSPLSTSPPKVHPNMVSLMVPSMLLTRAPSSVKKFLFPLEVSSVGPQQNIAVHQLGNEPRFPSNSKISHIGIPTPAVPISCQIKPHEPSSPLTKLRCSQQIANLDIWMTR
jgi:hypothetical protein